MDSSQSDVPSTSAVFADVFEVIEKKGKERCVEILDSELRRHLAESFFGKLQKQTTASAVCQRTTRQDAFSAPNRGSRRTFPYPFSRSPRRRPQKQRSYSERPIGSCPFFLPLRGFRGACPCARLPADTGGAQQAP